MTIAKTILLAAGCVAALLLGSNQVQAQGRGNYDPAQMRQRMMERIKDQMSVTNDDEWKVLEAAIGKVMDARMEVQAGTARGFGGGGGRPPRGGDNADNAGGQARQRNRGGGGPGGPGQPNPELEDLQKAIEEKAPADEIKAKLAKLRETNTASEAKLVAAQEDLKKLLTARQEAVAVVNGLLK